MQPSFQLIQQVTNVPAPRRKVERKEIGEEQNESMDCNLHHADDLISVHFALILVAWVSCRDYLKQRVAATCAKWLLFVFHFVNNISIVYLTSNGPTTGQLVQTQLQVLIEASR
jgi:hypothetical protein